jgi:hypothetical protein
MMRGRLSMKELTPPLGGGRAGFSLWRGWLWLWLACGMVLPALTQRKLGTDGPVVFAGWAFAGVGE